MTLDDLAALFARGRAQGLKGSSLHVALLLHIHGAAKPKALVADTGLSHSSLTQMMDRFQLEGWVTREPDPHDKRGTVVTLTAAGREKFKSIFEP